MELKKGISFWGYSMSYGSGRMSVEDMLAAAKKAGATGIELLPNRTALSAYPTYTQKDVETWFELLGKYQLTPICNAAMIVCNLDWACGATRKLKKQAAAAPDGAMSMANNPMLKNAHLGASHEEMVQLMRQEIDYTKAFGFRRMRHPLMTGVSKEAIEETLLYAEDNGIALDLEIHAPYDLEGPEVTWQLEMIERKHAKLSGLIPDLNAFQDKVEPAFRRSTEARGAEKDLLDYMDQALAAHEDMKKVADEIYTRTENDATLDYADHVSTLHPNNPEKLRDLAPYIHHFHAKFFEMAPDASRELVFDYPYFLKLLKDIGYSGYLMSEYEGYMYAGKNGLEEIEQIELQMKMIREIENKL